jgi:hypothetical protein
MGELIDFLLIAIFVLYIIRSLVRLVLPMIFQNVVNKAQQQQNQRQNYTSNSNTSQGKIKVDHIPTSKKGSVPDSEGEFVDYEEIK